MTETFYLLLLHFFHVRTKHICLATNTSKYQGVSDLAKIDEFLVCRRAHIEANGKQLL